MKSKQPNRTRLIILALFWGLSVLVGACAGRGGRDALNAGDRDAEVVERSEGYSSRPGWADENQPWSGSGEQLRIVGYVVIGGEQRMEAGNRAADSYARAELMRFLSVRVVASLEDRVATGEPELLREHIEETAQGVIDDLSVAGRYYEKRRGKGGESIHIYSRLDIDRATILSLMSKATEGQTDLRTAPEELVEALKQRWDSIADVGELNQDQTLLPDGFARPVWAEKGDRSDAEGFEFVCSGVGDDPKTAEALAQARCNEKLCRLFGVQITAKHTVTEDLSGVDAKSQVTEQCAEVRVEGRKVRYQSSDCGPKGCVHWFLQSYPKHAYLAERKRLDQPRVIRQEVVIQEGGKRYRDPAACETSLRAYGAVTGLSVQAFVDRKKHLNEALRVCQDIDGRDSGLFLSLYTLLTKPLPKFTRGPRGEGEWQVSSHRAFTVVSPEWFDSLDTMRFLTDRIQAVIKVVDGAILPLTLVELAEQGGTKEAVEKAITEVMAYPFDNEPESEHHLYYMHDAALYLGRRKQVPYSQRYRNYLLTQIRGARVECRSTNTVSGESVIEYLRADGELDDQEWVASLDVLKQSPPGDADSCLDTLFRKLDHGSKSTVRVDQVAQMIASGVLRSKDKYRSFDRLLDMVEKDKRADLYFRHVAKMNGSDKARKALVENITKSSFGWDWEYQRERKPEGIRACESLPERMKGFFDAVPEASTEDTALCMCLSLDGLSDKARKGIVALLFKYGDKTCQRIEAKDWPEEYYEAESPKTIPFQGRAAFSGNFSFIADEIKQCIEEHSVLSRPHMVTYLTVTLKKDRMSAAKAKTTIYGKLRDFEYRIPRRGYVHASDVHRMTQAIEGCIESAANRFVVPAVHSITKETGTHRLWFQIWDSNTGTNGFDQ